MSTHEWNAGRERRLAPRVDLLVEMQGHIITLDAAATVLQLSTLGMTVETTHPLSPNSPHDFRLKLEHSALDVRTRVVHTRMVVDRDDVSYVSGLAFVDLTPTAATVIDRLVDRLIAADDDPGARPTETTAP